MTMRTVFVQPGDTLSALALKHLGDAARWREIWALNCDTIVSHSPKVRGKPVRSAGRLSGADLIYPGTPLMLPEREGFRQ